MVSRPPLVTLETITNAVIRETGADHSLSGQKDFDEFTLRFSTAFELSGHGDAEVLRTLFNIFYTALRNSGNIPNLSTESLQHALVEVWKGGTGVELDVSQANKLKGTRLPWNKGFMDYFTKERERCEAENPNYFGTIFHLSMSYQKGGYTVTMPATAGIIVYRALEIELKKGAEKEDNQITGEVSPQ